MHIQVTHQDIGMATLHPGDRPIEQAKMRTEPDKDAVVSTVECDHPSA
jgi:hypothetical protein